jgi:hypothetical protein
MSFFGRKAKVDHSRITRQRKQWRELQRQIKLNRAAIQKESKKKKYVPKKKKKRTRRRNNTCSRRPNGPPVIERTNMRLFSTVRGNNHRFCISVPMCDDTPVTVVPVHPAFYEGRNYYMCKSYSSFRLLGAKLHYVPIVGTGTGGVVACVNTRHCDPIDSTDPWTRVVSEGAQISSVWQKKTFTATNIPKNPHGTLPTSRYDVPINFYVAVHNGTTSASCMLFLECIVEFVDSYSNSELAAPKPNIDYTSSSLGWSAPETHTGPVYGVITHSPAVNNVDLGEFFQPPNIAQADTCYEDAQGFHNGASMDPVNIARDRGHYFMIGCSAY